MLAKEEPEDVCPGKDSSEEALGGAIADAVTAPAGDAGHGDAARDGAEGKHHAAALAERGRRENRVETLEQC